MCLCGGMGWWFRVFWKDGTRVAVISMMSNCSTMNLWLLSTGQRPPLGGEGVICDKISGGKRMYIAKITKSQTPQTTNPNHHLSPTWLSDFVYLYYIWTSSNLPEFKLYKCAYICIYIYTHTYTMYNYHCTSPNILGVSIVNCDHHSISIGETKECLRCLEPPTSHW